MSNEILRKVDKLIRLIDRPCDCADGSCRLCRIMGLLLGLREDVESMVSAENRDSQPGTVPFN